MAEAIEEWQYYDHITIKDYHTRGVLCICARYCSRLLVW